MSEYITEHYYDGSMGIHFMKHEEIVRCRDCKYRYGCVHLVDNGDDDMRNCDATPDGFCSWGERREDA